MNQSRLLQGVVLISMALTSCAGPPAGGGGVFMDLENQPHEPLVVSDARAHVLIFITVDCPIANRLAPEIGSIMTNRAFQDARFFLIHVDPDVTAAAAASHASDYSLPGPVLLDPHHELVSAVGATITPEAVVLAAGGAVVYQGRINNLFGDIGKKRAAPSRHDLRNAITATLAGEPVSVTRTEAIGCNIPEPGP